MEKSITYPRHTNWTVKTTTHCQDLIKGKTFPYLTSPCQTFNICNYLLCSNIVKQQLLCFVGKVFQRFQPNMLLVFNSQTLEGDSIPLSKHKSHLPQREGWYMYPKKSKQEASTRTKILATARNTRWRDSAQLKEQWFVGFPFLFFFLASLPSHLANSSNSVAFS